MRSALRCVLVLLCLAGGVRANHHANHNPPPAQLANITVDYPLNHTLFPPDFAPPTFQWRDPDPMTKIWNIEVSFEGRSAPLELKSKGEGLQIGEIDERCAQAGAVPPTLTPQQTAAHTWKSLIQRSGKKSCSTR